MVSRTGGGGKGKAAEIEKDLRANLLPGVTIVPAMVIAIERDRPPASGTTVSNAIEWVTSDQGGRMPANQRGFVHCANANRIAAMWMTNEPSPAFGRSTGCRTVRRPAKNAEPWPETSHKAKSRARRVLVGGTGCGRWPGGYGLPCPDTSVSVKLTGGDCRCRRKRNATTML